VTPSWEHQLVSENTLPEVYFNEEDAASHLFGAKTSMFGR
jgi:hypothetical protein